MQPQDTRQAQDHTAVCPMDSPRSLVRTSSSSSISPSNQTCGCSMAMLQRLCLLRRLVPCQASAAACLWHLPAVALSMVIPTTSITLPTAMPLLVLVCPLPWHRPALPQLCPCLKRELPVRAPFHLGRAPAHCSMHQRGQQQAVLVPTSAKACRMEMLRILYQR